MTRTDLNAQWAWRRVEAMADGSLSAADRRRMRAAMRADPALEAAVQRAAALRRELQRLGRTSVPAPLRRRLLAIAAPAVHERWTERAAPRGRLAAPRRGAALLRTRLAVSRERLAAAWGQLRPRWRRLAAPAAAAVVLGAAAVIALRSQPSPPRPASPQAEQRERAVQEFALAMAYIQRSAAATSDGVTRELTDGLREALAVGRSAVAESESESENGG